MARYDTSGDVEIYHQMLNIYRRSARQNRTAGNTLHGGRPNTATAYESLRGCLSYFLFGQSYTLRKERNHTYNKSVNHG